MFDLFTVVLILNFPELLLYLLFYDPQAPHSNLPWNLACCAFSIMAVLVSLYQPLIGLSPVRLIVSHFVMQGINNIVFLDFGLSLPFGNIPHDIYKYIEGFFHKEVTDTTAVSVSKLGGFYVSYFLIMSLTTTFLPDKMVELGVLSGFCQYLVDNWSSELHNLFNDPVCTTPPSEVKPNVTIQPDVSDRTRVTLLIISAIILSIVCLTSQ